MTLLHWRDAVPPTPRHREYLRPATVRGMRWLRFVRWSGWSPPRRTRCAGPPTDAALLGTRTRTRNRTRTRTRTEECQRLTVADIPITARSGTARLLGKGDEVRTVPLPAPARERISACPKTAAQAWQHLAYIQK
jgi:hypothetical protein